MTLEQAKEILKKKLEDLKTKEDVEQYKAAIKAVLQASLRPPE